MDDRIKRAKESGSKGGLKTKARREARVRAVLGNVPLHCPACCDTMTCCDCPLTREQHCGPKGRVLP